MKISCLLTHIESLKPCDYSRLLCRRVMLSSLADLCHEHTTGTPWNVGSKNVLQDSGLVLLWGQFHSHSKKDKDRCNRILRLQYDLVLNQSKYLQKILMAVITCQGGVMINNCYDCMLMFACTFYNGFSAKKSHSTTNKSLFFFPWRQKQSYYWLWQHYTSYEINSFLLIYIYHTSFPSQKCKIIIDA